MNEKEIKRTERKFDEFGAGRYYDWTGDADELWAWIKDELVRAYHQGYMAGTMEAL